MHASFLRWAVLVLHRRAGKTTSILNHHQRAATNDAWESARLRALVPALTDQQVKQLLKRRVYWHVMPSYHQAKLTGAWDLLKEIARPIPGTKLNESELLMTYPNGNKVQLIGADKPDSLRGPGLSGLSLDEYSQIPGAAFSQVLSKALADHVGYCIFSGTIKGFDQLYDTYQAAKDDPEWFALWQNVDVSLQTEQGATITALIRAMEDDRKLILKGQMSQADFDQEWYLSPEAAIKGAIYGKLLAAARSEGRVTRVPHEPTLPVDTDWDLGMGDSMSIWFSQSLKSGEVRLIDYVEDSGEGFPYYIKILNEKRDALGYTYGKHWAPHDIAVRELGTGQSRLKTASDLGLRFQTTPRLTSAVAGQEMEEGINAARMLLPRCWFDAERCKAGLEALAHYRREFNQRLDEFKATPVHDWSSHGADAFRGLAVRHQVPKDKATQRQSPPPQSTSAGAWMGM